MQIKIKDTNRNPMWALQETSLHLSFENNEWLNVDLSNLTRTHLETLWLNIANGILNVENIEELENVLFPKKTIVLEKDSSVDIPSVLKGDKQAVELVEKAKKIKGLLSNNVATVKKSLPQLNLESLNMVYNLEQNEKNRKTILNLVKEFKNKLIKRQEESVAKNINTVVGNPNGNYLKHQLYKGVEKAYLDNITDIEESEEHEIIIHMGEEPDSS